VLERRRLALVAVDDEVDGLGLAQHRPLATGLEAGTSPAEEVGRVDVLVDLLARHLVQGAAQRVVPAVGHVPVERVAVGIAEAARDDLRRSEISHQALSPWSLEGGGSTTAACSVAASAACADSGWWSCPCCSVGTGCC